MIIKRAWYLTDNERIVVAEMPDNTLVKFNISPFRKIANSDITSYTGRSIRPSDWIVPGYVLPCYGLCAQP